jgi:hypothetical protein
LTDENEYQLFLNAEIERIEILIERKYILKLGNMIFINRTFFLKSQSTIFQSLIRFSLLENLLDIVVYLILFL